MLQKVNGYILGKASIDIVFRYYIHNKSCSPFDTKERLVKLYVSSQLGKLTPTSINKSN